MLVEVVRAHVQLLTQIVHVTGLETKFVMKCVMLLHIILIMVIVLVTMLVLNMEEQEKEKNLEETAQMTGLET